MKNKTMKSLTWLIAVAPGIVACQTVATNNDTPALITEPTDASRAALQQAVSNALNTEVMLADNALTDTSLLTIERAIPRGIDGSPAQGRTMDMPFQFRLVISGDECILIDQRDDSRQTLSDTSCIAED